MLTREEPGVKLLDFGISKSSDDLFETAMTASGQVVGTPAYMAPEQLTGKDLSGATDVYSLGLLVYEAASGSGPFEFSSAQEAFAAHAIDEPEELSKRVPNVPAEMSDLVARCLAKNPADRPAASEVARILGHIADTLGAPRATELGAVVAAAARAS